MQIEPTAVPGAWACTPQVHGDDRGFFLEWYRGDLLREVTGRGFDIVQANHSRSQRGVTRGIHYADVPPGQAKYVYCPQGAVLDVIVDLRVGSPTFGVVDAVRLDSVDRRGVFISEGLGHAFCALEDDSTVTYLVSATFNPTAEHGVSPVDAELSLPWPTDIGEIQLSEKDRAAPTLAEAETSELLPSYQECVAFYQSLA